MKSFAEAKKACIIGMGQNRMITSFFSDIEQILAKDGSIKVILNDPEGIATEMFIKRGSTRGDIDKLRQGRLTLERLKLHALNHPDKGVIEVKLIDILPSYTLYGFDIDDPIRGVIFIWINPFRAPSVTRPGFVLHATANPKWFNYFKSQFDNYWNWEEASTAISSKNINNN